MSARIVDRGGGVRVDDETSSPRLVNVTGSPSTSIPVRISGPLVSSKTAHTFPVLAHAALRFWSDSRWYSWVPWLKLKRACDVAAAQNFGKQKNGALV